MLWFNFILGLNFISLCFKLIIIYYHTPKQREIKFKPRIKLNHNIYKTNFPWKVCKVNFRQKKVTLPCVSPRRQMELECGQDPDCTSFC